MSRITEQEFRNAMGAFATGVTVVTCRSQEGRPIAMTVNSFTSVSVEPPLLLWCVNRQILPFAAFRDTSHFAIHVLHIEQQEISNHFAVDREDKFNGVEHEEGIGGSPILKDYLAVYQCETTDRIDAGDHVILVGRLRAVDVRQGEPLVFHGGRYRALELEAGADNA